MASIGQVLSKVADLVTDTIAPYQPNNVQVPNLGPFAGRIPATFVGDGHPMQLQGTVALEQGKAIVGVFDTKVEKLHSYTSNDLILGSDGIYYAETGRSYKECVIEVWAYTYEQRDALVNVIRGVLGDAFSFVMADGTTTKFLYEQTYTHDEQQSDSWWITRLTYRVDISATRPFSADGNAYEVIETKLILNIDDAGGDLLYTKEFDNP